MVSSRDYASQPFCPSTNLRVIVTGFNHRTGFLEKAAFGGGSIVVWDAFNLHYRS